MFSLSFGEKEIKTEKGIRFLQHCSSHTIFTSICTQTQWAIELSQTHAQGGPRDMERGDRLNKTIRRGNIFKNL
jgi:hypothetical protein